MKRIFITHTTEKYLDIAYNLAKSLETFSKIKLIVYCINVNSDKLEKFNNIKNTEIKTLDINVDNVTNYIEGENGNIYIDRFDKRFFNILSAKILAMKLTLEDEYDEVCYLDADCIATPIVDEIFNWSDLIKNYPLATKGIHEYMILIKDNIKLGNPFESTWPIPDNTKCLEYPLMKYLNTTKYDRGIYRTTGIMLMNKDCLPFINEWYSLCQKIYNDLDIELYAPFQEETVYNVLLWKYGNEGLPLCYINVKDGLDTIKDFYTIDKTANTLVDYDEFDFTKNFYKMPADKRDIKVLHGEKRSNEVDLILLYLTDLIKKGYFMNSNIYSEEIKKLAKKEYTSEITKNLYIQNINDLILNKNDNIELIMNFINGPYFEIKGISDSKFKVQVFNEEDTLTYEDTITTNMWVRLNCEYFVKWSVKVWENDTLIFYECLDFTDKRVYIALDSKALGDTLAWFPYVEEFRKKHNCKVICSTFWNSFFKDTYKEIEFVNPGDTVYDINGMYKIGWFYNKDGNIDYNKVPNNFLIQPLQKTASDILGLEYKEIRPNIKLFDDIKKENIISIAIHGTAQSKYWNNKDGWQKVVNYLKSKNYRVILLSNENDGYMGNYHPKGIEKLNSSNIFDVIKTLQKSKLFIGISSGISWLSWATKTNTVMISGFSEIYTEMNENTIKIHTKDDKCSGCFNKFRLDASDWNWCPKHKNTDRQFECTKSITSDDVINKIKLYI